VRLEIGVVDLDSSVNRHNLVDALSENLRKIGFEVADVRLLDGRNGFDLSARNDLLTTRDVKMLERVIQENGARVGFGLDEITLAIFSE